MNIKKNWALAHRWCMVSPVNSGNQWLIPAKMPNTAPILST